MTTSEKMLWGIVVLALGIALTVSIAVSNSGSTNNSHATTQSSTPFPTATVKQVPPQVSKEIYVDGEKLMMPFGKPDLVTFCYKGTRLFYGWYDAHSYGGVTEALWGISDPTCPM